MMLSQAMLTGVRGELSHHAFPSIMPSSYSWYTVTAGVRRLVLSGSPDAGPSRLCSPPSFTQTAPGTFAMNAAHFPRWPVPEEEVHRRLLLHDEQAVNARNVRAALSPRGMHAIVAEPPVTPRYVRSIPADSENRTIWFVHGGRTIADDVTGHQMNIPAHVAEAAAPLDALADYGPDLVSAACLLATELFQQVGVPEVSQVTRDGELRRTYWSRRLFQQIEKWADDAGVGITNGQL